jgi:2-phospho-L-lactate/phosphoenolpyruvate guanylyltransferase
MDLMSIPSAPWRVVLPVKGSGQAKSRLVVPGVSRSELAAAMFLDTLAAVLGCPLVREAFVVTFDPSIAAAARAAGAIAVPDPGAGLNGALRHGVETAERDGDGPIGLLLADLPALTPEDLGEALVAAAGHDAAYVPDLEGTGTVLLTGRTAALLRPEFGDGSAARHDAHATRLELPLPRLRRDVDVRSALQEAVAFGVGARTAAVLAAPSRAG